jgi:hypothetical protein
MNEHPTPGGGRRFDARLVWKEVGGREPEQSIPPPRTGSPRRSDVRVEDSEGDQVMWEISPILPHGVREVWYG